MIPKAAMIFAAGFGTRMAPLTDQTPKPMIKVDGKPLIDHSLSLLDGFETIVVNTHYLAGQIETHLAKQPNVTCLREEPEILETGGGLKNALPVLGSDPVVVMNSDAVFVGPNPVPELLARWNPDQMDALLTLVPIEQTIAHEGSGDFTLGEDDTLIRRGKNLTAPYVYSGVQILKTDRLAGISETSFSLNLLWNQMIAERRAFGWVYNGKWVDVGRPSGIQAAEKALADV
ncbi:nucleotidyltransferase family protein [Neptunicoccus cionae]|uniref:nucleotidyltransferase family protein n=1 Tax=Neptunicoccus cionae TaxID=2035344 RepID=UPI000C7561B1|nr:nucleotidyltransferase family protein [Amylibacter cionae]PLS22825.1 nucleotidyltransferase [Amylibacter cionae]